MTWKTDTPARHMIDSHQALLERMSTEFKTKRCPGLLWMEKHVSETPDISLSDLLTIFASEMEAGKIPREWAVDILAGQSRFMYPELRMRILDLVPVERLSAVIHHMEMTAMEKALCSVKGAKPR